MGGTPGSKKMEALEPHDSPQPAAEPLWMGEVREIAPDGDECLLRCVLGEIEIPGGCVGVAEDHGLVPLDQLGKGVHVAPVRSLHEPRHLHGLSSFPDPASDRSPLSATGAAVPVV